VGTLLRSGKIENEKECAGPRSDKFQSERRRRGGSRSTGKDQSALLTRFMKEGGVSRVEECKKAGERGDLEKISKKD